MKASTAPIVTLPNGAQAPLSPAQAFIISHRGMELPKIAASLGIPVRECATAINWLCDRLTKLNGGDDTWTFAQLAAQLKAAEFAELRESVESPARPPTSAETTTAVIKAHAALEACELYLTARANLGDERARPICDDVQLAINALEGVMP